MYGEEPLDFNRLPQTEIGAVDQAVRHYAIQPALWPEIGVSTEIAAYLKLKGPAAISLTRGSVDFSQGGTASSDCYYNLFNLGKWRALCGDLPFALQLRGKGRFQLSVWVVTQDDSRLCIFSEILSLEDTYSVPLDLSDVEHPSAVIFFTLTALSEGHLQDFAWTTSARPRQQPELLLSVTTFKREAAVKSTIERFARFREASNLRDHVRMIVVDNGRSVEDSTVDGVAVIPNENLGGAGGFSRGLLEARARGATHCLFMDDDASIHMGAVTRTWWFLAYTTDASTAVAGAMINADHTWQIWENGAIFERGCRPQYFGLDTRVSDHLFRMEHETTFPAPPGYYGGWWFFAFPVDRAKYMPFPFFVRGDDVSFSLANDFRIVTLPGVSSIQESFTDKASPLTWYLDMRSHLAHHLSLPSQQISWLKLQRMFIGFYLRTILRFHYESLSAVNLAIEDVMQGPQFFADNADMAERREILKALTQTEAWTPTDRPPKERRGRCSRPLRALLLLTLNGHLLPFTNTMGSHLIISARDRENFREMYGAKQIVFLNARRSKTYTVRRDRKKFFSETFRMLRNSVKLWSNYSRIRSDWEKGYNELASEEFWNWKLFDKNA